MNTHGNEVFVPRTRLLEGAAGLAALAALLASVEVAVRTEIGAQVFAQIVPHATAQDDKPNPPNPGNTADAKSKAPAEPSGAKKEDAENEGDPKFPPVLSWKVKVKLKEGEDEDVILFTRTEDGKRTKVEFEGYAKEDNPIFELPVRLPVDTSPKEKDALVGLIAQALFKFYGKGDPNGAALALKNGKIPMTTEPKTIDWEVVAEQNDHFTTGHTSRARFLSDGESTIVIFSDKGGGYVVRVAVKLPENIKPEDKGNNILLRRILFGADAANCPDGTDTYENRLAQERGSHADDPNFAPRFRVIRHHPKEVSTKTSDIKKE